MRGIARRTPAHDGADPAWPSFDANDRAGFKRVCRGNAMRFARQGGFTEKAGRGKVGDDGFLAAHRYDGELDLAALDVENCIGRVALRKDGFSGQVFAPRFSGHIPVQRTLKVECGHLLRQSAQPISVPASSHDAQPKAKGKSGPANPGSHARHCSEASSHDRYLSTLQRVQGYELPSSFATSI
jgi:hypothetical protein